MSNETAWYDVIETLQEKMCVNCPNWGGACMPNFDKEGDNFDQMIVCMENLKDRLEGKYPTEEELSYPRNDEEDEEGETEE